MSDEGNQFRKDLADEIYWNSPIRKPKPQPKRDYPRCTCNSSKTDPCQWCWVDGEHYLFRTIGR